MMKKINGKKVLASVLSGLLILTGCTGQNDVQESAVSEPGLNPDEQKVYEVVESYLNDFKEGKLVDADKYISSDLEEMQFGKMMDMVTSIYETLGMNSSQIDMVKNTLSTALSHLVEDYQIETVSETKDDQYAVVVHITGISVESLASIESDDLINAVTDAIGGSDKEGELDDSTFQKALDTIVEKIDETPAETSQATFTLKEENGSWLICDTSNFGQLQNAASSFDEQTGESEQESADQEAETEIETAE